MPDWTAPLYRGTLALGRTLLPAASLVSTKLRDGHEGRGGSLERLTQWAAAARRPTTPLVWLHASSVGEGHQASAVLRRLRERHPEWQFAFTYFSPSAAPLSGRIGADVVDYLPYDGVREATRLLQALRPSALVFTKLDLWPELATRAAAEGVAVGLIAGTVRAGSGRLRWPARLFLRSAYACLNRAAAVAPDDRSRLIRLGVAADRIEVLGDPRYDSALELVAQTDPADPLLRFGRGAPTLVAGSTWPGDEDVLLNAFSRLHVHRPAARLILVPHEPTSEHLTRIEQSAARLGLPRPVRLSAATEPVPLLLVDQVGALATLYGAGTIACVGGGFHRAGLHSVLEPAAWGIPVVFGPRWTESRDAGLLLEAGGAEALSELGTSEASESLQAIWEAWISDEVRRAAQGRKARELVRAGAGAALRSAELVERLVDRTG